MTTGEKQNARIDINELDDVNGGNLVEAAGEVLNGLANAVIKVASDIVTAARNFKL